MHTTTSLIARIKRMRQKALATKNKLKTKRRLLKLIRLYAKLLRQQ